MHQIIPPTIDFLYGTRLWIHKMYLFLIIIFGVIVWLFSIDIPKMICTEHFEPVYFLFLCLLFLHLYYLSYPYFYCSYKEGCKDISIFHIVCQLWIKKFLTIHLKRC